jgi:hypothetical protein
LSAPVVKALASKGVTRLFTHQAQALNAVLSGVALSHGARHCQIIQGILLTVDAAVWAIIHSNVIFMQGG